MFTFSGEQGAGTQRRKEGKSTEEGKVYTRSKITKVTLIRICDKETWSHNQYFATAKIETMRLDPQRKRRELKIQGKRRGEVYDSQGTGGSD